MRKRVHYKLLLLTYKTLNGSAPEYLVNQLQDYCPTRVLRSADQNLLSVKMTCIKIGDSSFTVAGCAFSGRPLARGDWKFGWAIGNLGGLLECISMVAHRAIGNKIDSIMVVR